MKQNSLAKWSAMFMVLGVLLFMGCSGGEENSGGDTKIINGIECVLVKAGTFMIGSPTGEAGRWDDETQHQVIITEDFYISRHEVTQAQYEAVTGTNPSYSIGSNKPVERVSWDNAKEFCDRVGGFLPTEAQWEYAARGGNKSNGYIYSGSNDLNAVAWYEDNSSYKTQASGQKQSNELGIYDMSGNVWEWCSDWYGDYGTASQTNPVGYGSGSDRIIRGGSLDSDELNCRVALRNYTEPDYGYTNVGFRVCFPREGAHTHSWGSWTTTKNATCDETGEQSRKCSLCGETQTQYIPVLTGSQCYGEHIHNWGDWTITKNATCDEEGEQSRTCLLCGEIETQSIPVLTGSECEEEHIHNWGDWTTTKDATCDETGEQSRKCSLCGETQTQSIPKLTGSECEKNCPATKTINGIECVLVEAGTFIMGSPESELRHEYDEVQHQVMLTENFYMSKYEVTQAQYAAVMGDNPSAFKSDNHPVESVSWDNAKEFCDRVGGFLPTEAQWEYAARGGNKNSGYHIYSGSDDLDAVGWYWGNIPNRNSRAPYGSAQEVGQKQPNELGIYDMTGNVTEWCSDWEGYYLPDPDIIHIDPAGPDDGNKRLLRGGSWQNDVGVPVLFLRVACRLCFSPSYIADIIGFRVCFPCD